MRKGVPPFRGSDHESEDTAEMRGERISVMALKTQTPGNSTPPQGSQGINASEETWELLNTSAMDDAEARKREEAEDLDQMRRDPETHMTAAVARHVVCWPEGADAPERGSDSPASIVLRHLRRCLWCRNMLFDALELSGVDKTHPGYGLVARAEKWARWAAAGARATEGARRFLREQGANI